MNLIKELEKNRLPDFADKEIKGLSERYFNHQLLPYCDEIYLHDNASISVLDYANA